AVNEFFPLPEGAEPRTEMVRYRTVGDATSTGAVRSTATDYQAVIEETAVSRITERGATRGDDLLGSGDGGSQARGLLLVAEMLRIATAGSVDDGKSTLIGRLLYETKSIFEDQLESIER